MITKPVKPIEPLPPEDLIVKARIAMLNEYPFFGDLAVYLEPVAVPGMNPATMGTDGKHLFYEPEYVKACTSDILKVSIMHEVGHILFQTSGRCGLRDKHRFNMAADHAINLMLKSQGHNFPEWWLCDKRFDDMTAEEIYNLMPQPKKVPCSCGGEGTEAPEGKNQQRAFDHIHELPSEVSQDEASRKAFETEWKWRTAKAAAHAKQMGKLPAGFEELIESLVEPKVDWRSVIRNFMSSTVKTDYRRIPPSRRWLHAEMIQPSMQGETSTVAFVLDTSGSMSSEDLQRCISEVAGAMDMNPGLRVLLVQCDADVHSSDLIEDSAQLQNFKVRGRGGTSFVPAFDHVSNKIQEGVDIKALLYLTDMMGTFPSKAPGYPVLWVRTTKQDPPFGEVIEMDE